MTFLNPLLLFGLAAAAIPILIHLFNRRNLRTIDFSSLRFLKELQKTTIRRVRIRQWILLLVRTLLIISLVLAFSRPAIKGSLAGVVGSRARTSMVILLDDSPSMSVRTDRGVAFSMAKQAAMGLLSVFEDGDVAYVVPLSAIRTSGSFSPLYNSTAIRNVIESLSPSQISVPFREGFASAARLLSEKSNLNREIFLVSDMQATMFEHRPAADTAALFSGTTSIFFMNVGQEANNVGISSVALRSRLLSGGRPTQLDVTIGNYSTLPLQGGVLSIYLDGTRQVQQLVDADPYSTHTAGVTVLPRSAGLLHGYAQIDDDVFDLDSRRYFVLSIPQQIPVLLVGENEGDARLPLLALKTSEDSSGAGLVHVHYRSASQLPGSSLHDNAVVLLCGIQRFAPSLARWVVQFVQSGGGLIVFPALHPDISSYNNELFAPLGIPPARFVSDSLQDESFTFGRIDFAHPVFSGIFDNTAQRQREQRIESPVIHSALWPQPGPNGQTIVALTNSQGFLTEYRSGEGKMLLFSVEAGMTGSDFPVRGLFVPLLHRSVLYLATDASTPDSLQTGERAHFSMQSAALRSDATFSLRAPSGSTEKLVPVVAPTTGIATFTGSVLTESGVIELRESTEGTTAVDSVLKAAAVNISPLESDLREADSDSCRAFGVSLGAQAGSVTMIDDPDRVGAEVLQSRIGVELWRYFLMLALVCAFAEMIIGREAKQSTESSPSMGH